MRRSVIAICLMLASAGLLVSVAAGAGSHATNGGTSIASAPPLPLDQQISSGWTQQRIVNDNYYGEFWRVPLNAGDRLIMDVGASPSKCDSTGAVNTTIWAPTVTDFTVGQTSSVIREGHYGKYELHFDSPSSGTWTVMFDGCYVQSFVFIARVQQVTHTSVSVPSLVAANHRFTVRGVVKGATGGNLAIRVSATKQKPLSYVVPIGKTGSFSKVLKLAKKARYTVSATYYGDNGHRPSKAAARINVG
jgi:hypothetical protein